MDMKIFTVLVFLTQFHWTLSLTTSISGEISEDVTFILKRFPVPPSIRAIIEVDVYDTVSSLRPTYPMMGIYTTNNHVNIEKQCTYLRYGQLGNQNLHIRIRNDRSNFRNPRCLGSDGKLHCIGNVTVQDFKPRNFSFSFGFRCHRLNARTSLKGLVYNVSIHGQTNETKCLPYNTMGLCKQYFQHGVLPNLAGGEDMMAVSTAYRFLKIYIGVLFMTGLCHQHFEELACHVLIPKCDPVTTKVIHPCREMCIDFRTACSKIKVLNNISSSDESVRVTAEDNMFFVHTTFLKFDCDYLPSLKGDIPCFYKPVTCNSPPSVKKATVLNTCMIYNNYSVLDTVDYSCNEGFEIKGNKKISCLYSGNWTAPPKCSLRSTSTIHPLVVVLPVLLFPLAILFATVLVRNRTKLKKETPPDMKIDQVELDTILMGIKGTDRPLIPLKRENDAKRNSFFDAFVFYHFDSDSSFVINNLLPELEDKRRFRLFIHSRNFVPGHEIIQNIEEAIEASNSAIILMSQGFVDSIWCKDEFTHCYMENMKDPAFNLFVIMMQPAGTLVNTSPNMKAFFKTKTFLEKNDPYLFKKLATHLNNARKADNDDDVDDDDDDDGDDDDDDSNHKTFTGGFSAVDRIM